MKQRVYIRAPVAEDCTAFLAGVRRSRALHRPWVAPPATRQAYRDYLERISSPLHWGFLVITEGSGDLVGVININNIICGNFLNGFLGYYAFLPWAGQGLMTGGMMLVLENAFNKLKLHRLEANIQPGNLPSIALAKNCGFTLEGFSPRYLKVRGRWQDHERWAIRAETYRSKI
jgi:ribosomal-protein-alanine N-acetyltransferase